MSAPFKTGLDYFSFDVDFFDDDKIALLSSEFGATGELIVVRLFTRIYKNGYFYPWGDDECLIFCRWSGGIFRPSQVQEVVNRCLKRSIFDEGVFKMFGILTSRGIQKRYILACGERKQVSITKDFWLIDLPNGHRFKLENVNRPINGDNHPINEDNRPSYEQSKVKESKVKETPPIPPIGGIPADSDLIQKIILEFNSKCIALPPVKSLTEKRKKAVSARLREHGLDKISEMLLQASSSKFLAGQNKNEWVADFDWIFRPNNFVKVLEGNYSKSASINGAKPTISQQKNDF